MIQTVKQLVAVEVLTCVGLMIFYFSLKAGARLELGKRPIAVGLAIPPALFLSPWLSLLHLFVLLIVPLAARRREQVAAVYLFALLLMPAFSQPLYIGSLQLVSVDLHVTLGVGSLAALLLKFPQRRSRGYAADIPFLILFFLLVFPYARGEAFTVAIRAVVQQAIVYGIPYYLVSRSLRSWADVRLAASCLACAATILGIILLFEAKSTWMLYRILYGNYGLELTAAMSSVQIRYGLMRAVGPFLEPTSMAFAFLLCLLATVAIRKSFSPFYFALVIALMLAAIFTPQSRGAWIGLAVALVMTGIYTRRYLLPAVALTGAALLLALAQISPSVSEAMGMSGGATGTVDYRERLFERGMEEIWKAPIIGDSQKAVYTKLADLQQGQGIVDFVNTYLYVALVSGVLGLLIFLGALAAPAFAMWGVRSRMRSGAGDVEIGAMVFAGLVAPIEMLAFTSLGGRPAIMIFAFMALATVLTRARPMQGDLQSRETAVRSQDVEAQRLPALPAIRRGGA